MALVADANVADWRRHFEVNLFSCVSLTQATLPLLRESRGKVIAVSSGAARSPLAGWSAYSCGKAALNMFVECLAREEKEITSIAVRPGMVDTAMQLKVREEGKDVMGPDHNKFADTHSAGKLLLPQVPAEVIVNLAERAPQDWSGLYLSWDDERVKLAFQG